MNIRVIVISGRLSPRCWFALPNANVSTLVEQMINACANITSYNQVTLMYLIHDVWEDMAVSTNAILGHFVSHAAQ